MDRTLGQMVKAKLYRQNHTKKHTHTHSQKEKKGKNIYIVAPKVNLLNLGCFVVYSVFHRCSVHQVDFGDLILSS